MYLVSTTAWQRSIIQPKNLINLVIIQSLRGYVASNVVEHTKTTQHHDRTSYRHMRIESSLGHELRNFTIKITFETEDIQILMQPVHTCFTHENLFPRAPTEQQP